MSFSDTQNTVRECDCLLPINNIEKTMKNGVPENTKISKDAKETAQLCTSEFISFISSEAADRCLYEKRKTITGDDIANALEALGFDNHSYLIRVYLEKLREMGRA